MAYRYTQIESDARAKKGVNPKNNYVELFQETLNGQFYNSSNWWTIQEETSLGSRVYQDVDVRIAHTINAETGLKIGNDWKTLYFISTDKAVDVGNFYKFDDNTWITTNVEKTKNLTVTCTIRRCNNTLRWIDEDTGAIYEEPCVLEYLIKEPRDYATQGSPFKVPGGFIHIEMQLNLITKKITHNKRFLIGNDSRWSAWRVVGAGVNNYKNTETYDMDSAKILSLDLIADFLNPESDNVDTGIADYKTNVYTVTMSSSAISGSPTDIFTLGTTLLYNGHSASRPMAWSSSDTDVATASSGIITFVSAGSCTITANINDNTSACGTCVATVSASPSTNNEIVISPNQNYMLEGVSGSFGVFLYSNGVKQVDTFTITVEDNAVPTTSYVFSASANAFMVSNVLRNDSSYLTVSCTTGSVIATKEHSVYLRGAWLQNKT